MIIRSCWVKVTFAATVSSFMGASDPDPSALLRDFKSYASRRLNRNYGQLARQTWWSGQGSKRKLPDDEAVHAAIPYVRDQAQATL